MSLLTKKLGKNNFLFDSVLGFMWKLSRFQQNFWATHTQNLFLHGIAMRSLNTSNFSWKPLRPTFVYTFLSFGVISKVPRCAIGTKYQCLLLELVSLLTTCVYMPLKPVRIEPCNTGFWTEILGWISAHFPQMKRQLFPILKNYVFSN